MFGVPTNAHERCSDVAVTAAALALGVRVCTCLTVV